MKTLDEILADYDADAPLARASTIPGSWYTDARVHERERETVFSRSWQLVGRAEQLAEPGAYVTAEIAGEPIVVVRGHDKALRAFFNVCRHHAAAVMTECAGKADRLRCPYHGWTYSLDGALKTVTELEGVENFDRSELGLVPVRVATWQMLVFVCLDPSSPPLDEWLGERLRRETSALGLERLHFVERREWTLACNWKVFVDNYLDGGYHVPFLHKELNRILAFTDYRIECFDRVCLQSSPVDDPASLRRGRAAYYWLYPNLTLNWYEGYLDTNYVVPLGHDRMKVVFDFYFADREEARTSIDASARIQDEDHAICESVQRGLGSRAYQSGRLSARREAGEHLFHRLLAADLRAAGR